MWNFYNQDDDVTDGKVWKDIANSLVTETN